MDAQAAWREERARMVQGYHEAMELRDRALHQQECANADAQRLHGECVCVYPRAYMFVCMYIICIHVDKERDE